MSAFENVTITKKANVYYDGKVTSRTITFEDGSIKTLGFMLAGDYEFNTDKPELMEILSGTCRVTISGEGTSKSYASGDSFNVPGSSCFAIKTIGPLDYCCSFLDEQSEEEGEEDD